MSNGDIRLTDADIERRLAFVGFVAEDAGRIARVRALIERDATSLASSFFTHLESLPEARALFADHEALARARALKERHVRAMVAAHYGAAYVDERVKLARIYARASLPVAVFLGAFHHMMSRASERIVAELGSDGMGCFLSLRKIGFFDIGVIVDQLIHDRELVIEAQREAIKELSTPVLQLRPGLVVMPIVGAIDTDRARQIMSSLLRALREKNAKVAILDVTGVPTMDSAVAAGLLRAIESARMMGTVAIVTGIAPAVARALVTLGFDASNLAAFGDLEDGVDEASRLLSLKATG